MKKLLLTIVSSIILSSSVIAQNVARECVLYEIFTGVNCPYCPAAALSMGRLLEEGKSIAAVAYHTNAFSVPDFFTNETNARASYYNISGYPSAKVDGVVAPYGIGGGANDQEYIDYAYSQLLSAYNQRINVTSPYTIDMEIEHVSGTECKITATATKVGEHNAADVRLFIVMTESHIQRSWQGLSELNFVTRDMIPNQNGTQLTSDTQTVEATFNLNNIPRENCEIIAWVQSYTGYKEVFQAVKFPMSELSFDNDIAIRKVEEVVLGSCSSKMSPRVTLKNVGKEDLTSALFNIKADNEVVSTYEWNGNIAVNETVEVIIPEFSFGDAANVAIEVTEVNANDDGFPADNTLNIDMTELPLEIEDGYIKLQLRTGEDPENLKIEITNMDDGEVIHTFTYDEPKEVYEENIILPKVGCYRMSITNSEGNGFGGGFWGIKNSNNVTLITGSNTNNDFRYGFFFEFNNKSVDVEETELLNMINIYPNPATSVINISANNLANIKIYNAVGQLIYNEETANDNVTIDTQNFSNGFYYVTIETANGNSASQKIIVNK